VAIGFTMEDNQGLEDEVLKGGSLLHATLSCPPRVDAEELCPSDGQAWYDSLRTHRAEGKEDPDNNAPRGPIVGSLEVVVRLVSVDGFRDRSMSSPSGEIGWAFAILRDVGRRSDNARAHRITVDGVDGHSISRVELVLER